MVSRMSLGHSDCLVQFILTTTTKVLLCVARQHRASCHMINTLFKLKKNKKKQLGLFGTFFCFKTPLKTQTKTCCSLYSVTLSKIAVDFPLIKIAFFKRLLYAFYHWKPLEQDFFFFKYTLWGREWMKLSGDSGLVLNDKTELHKLSKKLQKNLQRCVGTATSTHWSVKWKVKHLLLAHVFVSAKHFCDQAVVQPSHFKGEQPDFFLSLLPDSGLLIGLRTACLDGAVEWTVVLSGGKKSENEKQSLARFLFSLLPWFETTACGSCFLVVPQLRGRWLVPRFCCASNQMWEIPDLK